MRTNKVSAGVNALMVMAVAGACAGFGTRGARGTPIYWDGTGTSWATASDWSTASNATTPNPAAPPGSLDTAEFNITTLNTNQTLTLDGNTTVGGMIVNSTGTVTINSGIGANPLSLANAGQFTINAGAGAVTINAAMTFGSTPVVTNNGALLTINGNVSSGTVNVGLNGSGNMSFTGAVTTTNIMYQGTGTVTFSGAADNTSFGLLMDSGTSILAKASSSTVHAAYGLALSGGNAQLGGTGGDQIQDSWGISILSGTLDMNGKSETISVLSGSGGVITNQLSSTTSTLTIGATNVTGAYSGQITNGSGAVALVKTGSGNITLGGASNGFTGGTSVLGGNFILGANGAAGTGTLIVNGGHYIENGFNDTVASVFVGGNATVAGSPSNLTVNGGNLTVNGTFKVWAGEGAVVFSSGMITVNGVDMNGAPGNFLWTGGTLKFGGPVLFDATQNIGNVINIGTGQALVSGGEQLASQTSNVTYNQTGGSNSSASWVEWGFTAGFTTTYNLSGGTLSAPSTGAGLDSTWGNGNVVFNQTGGTATFGDIEMAFSTTANASLTLNDPTGVASFTANNLYVGGSRTAARGNASVSITKDTMTVAFLKIWSPTGSVALNSGTLNAGVLDTSGSSSVFTWTTGNLNITAGGFVVDTGGPVGATLNLPTGKNLTTTGGTTNNGTITLAGGTIGGTGQVTNNDYMSGWGTVGGAGGFENNGEVATSGGTLLVSGPGPLDNEGNIDLALGSPLQIMQNADGGTFTNEGTINLNGSAVIGSAMLFNVGGTIVGRGQILTPFQNVAGILEVPAGTLLVENAFTNSGVIYLTDVGANLTGNLVANAGTIQGQGILSIGVINNGSIEAIGGTLILGSSADTLGGNGTVRVGTGNKVLAQQGIAVNSGTISLTGGTFDNNGFGMSNVGEITGYGVLSTGGLTNVGNVTFTGGTTTVNGAVTNSSPNFNVKFNAVIFTGNVTNNVGATITVTQGTVAFGAAFVNNGTYTSDPSTTTFQSDVTNGGVMSGGVGDAFHLTSGTFTNSGTFSNGGTLSSGENVNNTGSFVQTGAQVWASGSVFTNNGGTATFGSNAANLSVVVKGGSVTFAASQNLAGLTVNGGVAAITGGTVKTNGVTFGGGMLDVQRSDVIVEGGNAAAIRGEVGTGIVSSTLVAGQEIVVVDNSLAGLTALGGQSVDAGSILVVPTYAGDANLDGVVDLPDLQALATHWQGDVSNWTLGDFNGDGVVDLRDLQVLATHWQDGAGSGGGSGSFSESLALVGGLSSVPEPGTIGVMGIGGVILLRRRRG